MLCFISNYSDRLIHDSDGIAGETLVFQAKPMFDRRPVP